MSTPFQRYLIEQLQTVPNIKPYDMDGDGVPDLIQKPVEPVKDPFPGIDDDYWHPPMAPPDIDDIVYAYPDLFNEVMQEFADWIIENFAQGNPIVAQLMSLFGFGMEDLLNANLTGEQILESIIYVIRNWGDPSVGGQVPDFPFRGPIMTGNLGSGEGFGGLFGTISNLLNDYLDQIMDGTLYGDDPQTADYIAQFLQMLIDAINQQEGNP